jgi:hypothetical protein
VRLVWSQSSPARRGPRNLLLVAVICIFLGGVGPGAADGPRAVRAAAASLLLTGGVLLLAGGAAWVFQRARRPGARLSLAPPVHSPDSQPQFERRNSGE